MFTASHNPARYNGLKLCLSGARPIGRDTGLTEIQATAEALLDDLGRRRRTGDRADAMAPIEARSVLEAYATHVRSFVDVDALRPLRVVADTANGMGGLVAPKVFEGLPFEVEILFAELDGNFPNHPADPIQPENLVALKQAVLESQADVGLAFDGDADRVFLVDERAETVSGSLTTALVASSMLEKHPGPPCSTTASARGWSPRSSPSSAAWASAPRSGTATSSRSWRTPAPSSAVSTRATTTSGTTTAPTPASSPPWSCSSCSVSPASRSPSCSSRSGATPTRGRSTPWSMTRPGAVELLAAEVESAGGARGMADRLDGLTVDRGDWWYNVRPSNTEPLLRLNVEAPDDASCARHVAEVQSDIGRLLGTERREAHRPTHRPGDDGRRSTREEGTMTLDPLLIEVLACPEDKGPLLYFADEDRLYNPRLHRSYEVRDGIPVMLIDEADRGGRGRARPAHGQGRRRGARTTGEPAGS